MGEVIILKFLKTLKIKHFILLSFIFLFLFMSVGALFIVFNTDVQKQAKKHTVHILENISHAFLKTQKGLPILSYHGVDNKPWGIKEYFVSSNNFENQIKYLKQNGYTCLSIKDIDNFKSYEKPVIITFDDGYENVYKNAYPILKKYNMHATLFMVSDFVDKKYYLSTSQLKIMTDVFDIQSHTKTHTELSKTTPQAVNFEMSQSKLELSTLLDKQIVAVSYPYSKVDAKVTIQTAKHYRYGILNWGGKYYGFEGPYRIPRIPIHWEDTLEDFIKKIN